MEVCTKTKYLNKDIADQEVKRIKGMSTRKVIPCRSYLCEKCGTWHLTSKDDKNSLLILKLQEKVREQKDQINILNQRLAMKNEQIKELKGKVNYRGSVPDKLTIDKPVNPNVAKFNNRYRSNDNKSRLK